LFLFFFDPLVYPDVAANYDRILDFEINSDRLDIAEPLKQAGYTGTDPVADGYISINPLGVPNSLELKFDADGSAGALPGNTLAVLENVDPTAFGNELNKQLIVTPTEF
ncbi:MAG: hypothetical protein RLZZ69_3792, partial [Cyanobacteriota bacterium]